MKKVIKFIFSIVIFSFLLIAINVRAVYDGTTTTFFVRINTVENVKSGSIEVSYDTTALEITKGYWEFHAPVEEFNKETNEGVFAFSEPRTLSDLIFGMTFKVKNTAKEKEYKIKINIKLIDVNNKETVITDIRSLYVNCSHIFSEKIVDDYYLMSEATCTTRATYFMSCKYCGKAGTATFTNGSSLGHKFNEKLENMLYVSKPGTCTTKTEYYYACSLCYVKGTETYIGSETPSHFWKTKWKTDEENHWKECFCGEKTAATPHTYDNDCDADCNVCGYERSVSHIYVEWSSDTENHWKECSCGAKEEAKSHVYDNDCDADCNVCGYFREVTHTFSSWVSDVENHWKECPCGAKEEAKGHVYDNDCDIDCNVCGYERSVSHIYVEWLSDEENHWKECSCGAKEEAKSHAYDNDCDADCNECGYERSVSHIFVEWSSDEENHWKECSCGEKKNEENHKFDNGVTIEEATTKADGLIKYSCECGYEKFEVVPKLPKKGCKKDLSALVVGLISLSMLGVLLKKKNR